MEKIAIIGVGVVGLELAVQLAKHYSVYVYNDSQERINQLKKLYDKNDLFTKEQLNASNLNYVTHPKLLNVASIFIMTLPTDIHQDKTLDLEPIKEATQTLGQILKPQDIVIFESSVYPKFTEEVLIPILEEISGLKVNEDFFVAYCPERFSPKDVDYELNKICKVISVSHPCILSKVKSIYEKVCADIYVAPNLAVAECSKMLENIQRNLNIALMNEFSKITHALDISLHEVLQATATKKNFLPFQPGLVGGYCIPVNPFYVMYQARKKGIEPCLIQAAQTVNESMPAFIFSELLKLYFKHQKHRANPRIAVFGLSFKPNIPDIRHSLSLDFIELLKKNNLSYRVHDPFMQEGMNCEPLEAMKGIDIAVFLVKHQVYVDFGLDSFLTYCQDNPIIMDVGGLFKDIEKPKMLTYWQL